jgi:hemolysin activation/secretion protein
MEPLSGFLVEAAYQKSHEDFGSDFGFQRFMIDVRRYLYLTSNENIDARIRLGSTSGELPGQLAFDLGGVGSLRGYRHKEFRDSDRLLLGNLEYRLCFGRVAPGVLEDYQLIPFYDFGLAWASNDSSSLAAGFDQLKASRLKTDVGIGLSLGADDRLRIDLARRLDDRDQPMVASIRIHRIF